MSQPDIENTNITSSAGAWGVVKHGVSLTMIIRLSVSGTRSALLFNSFTLDSYVLGLAIAGCLMLTLVCL